MVFKQIFKYLKNEKNKFIKVILKLECSIRKFIYCFILFYIRRTILTQTNSKKNLIQKKTHHIRKNVYSHHMQTGLTFLLT